MNIHHVNNPAHEAGKKVSEILMALSKPRRPILFLISGGSSLKVLNYIEEDVLGPHITIVALDERFSREQESNNFLQIKQTSFYDKVIADDVTAIDTTPGESETIDQLAQRWDEIIKEWQEEHPKGVIIGTAGIGDDGHVAGMLPYPEDKMTFEQLFMSDKLVVGYDAGNKNKYNLRVTSTMTLLKQISHVVSFVIGESKKSQIMKAQETDRPLHECPARILFQLPKGDLYTDINL